MHRLLIFDLDGTLIDSKKDIAVSLNHALQAEGFPTLSDQVIQDLVGRGARRLVKEAIGNPTDEQLGKVFLTFWNHYHEHCLDHTDLYPGVRELLERHRDLPMAVVTNKPELFSKKILEALDINRYFRWLIAGDTLATQKPDPKVFEPILKDLAGPVHAIIVGDSDVDINCGKAAGFKTCAVTYGFRTRAELEEYEPDFMIDRLEELSELSFFQAA